MFHFKLTSGNMLFESVAESEARMIWIFLFLVWKKFTKKCLFLPTLDISDFGRYTRANRRQVRTFESLIGSTCSTKWI